METEYSRSNRSIVSFIRARDPSILTYNFTNIKPLKLNLQEKFDQEESKDDPNSLQIYLRVKPGVPFHNLYNIEETTIESKIQEGTYALRNLAEGTQITKKYSFSKIFPPEASQSDVFNQIVKSKVLDFINGNNCTLLTYGASGSGKTYTIVGTPLEPGLVPRALEYFFKTVKNIQNNPTSKPTYNGNVSALSAEAIKAEKLLKKNLLSVTNSHLESHIKAYKDMQARLSTEPGATLETTENASVSVWVSFAEIYNEYIYDLLLPPLKDKQRPKLKLAGSNENVFIKNLTQINIQSGLEAYQILQKGLQNLNFAETSVNSHSSRSHSIFTITMVQSSSKNHYTSYFNFCDLAGAERLKKTLNVGDRLKESNNINSSLLVLGRCISTIRANQNKEKKSLVPFRESKLTQLFQKALSGHERIFMMVNINPSREMFDETQHVLNFSAIAKDIKIIEPPKPVLPEKKNRFSQYVLTRSTSIAPIPENDSFIFDDSENPVVLRSLIERLINEKQQILDERDEEMKIMQETMDKQLKELSEHRDQYYAKKIEFIEKKWKKKCDELKALNMEYEEKENAKKRQRVVCLDSSDEEDVEQTSKSEELKIQNEALHLKCKKLENENETLKKQLVNEKNKNSDLELTLQDAKSQFNLMLQVQKELEEEKKNLLEELIKLNDKVEDLEFELKEKNQPVLITNEET